MQFSFGLGMETFYQTLTHTACGVEMDKNLAAGRHKRDFVPTMAKFGMKLRSCHIFGHFTVRLLTELNTKSSLELSETQ